ncbi:MAG: cytochrome c oxidase assembly protein [Nitrososphaerota archaeon]
MWSALADWTLEPTVIAGLAIAALLYGRGVLYSRRHGQATRLHWWHVLAFYGGLLVIFIALESALDGYSERFLWAHMIQHELLIMIAPPLLLLGMPTLPMWRAVPLAARRSSLQWLLRKRGTRRAVHQVGRFFSTPAVCWAIYIAIIYVWHLPALYGAALDNVAIHAFQHLCFMWAGLFLWSQVLPWRPGRPRLSYSRRAVYLVLVGLASKILDSVFMFSTGVIYPYYASLPRKPGTITVLEDQHIAGAIMSVSGVIIITSVVMVMIGLWLQAIERLSDAPVRPRPMRS